MYNQPHNFLLLNKNIQVRTFLLFFLILGVTAIQAQTSPTTELQTKTVTAAPFTDVKLYSGIEGVLVPGTENKVVVSCDDPDSVIVIQKNNSLRIRVSLAKVVELPAVYVEIHYTTPLDQIDLNQGSSLRFKETMQQTSINLKVQEGAKLVGAFDVVKLRTDVDTGGQVELHGKAKNHQLNVTSGGTCEAEKLITEQSTVRVTAGGVAYANATKLMEAKVNFNGTIRVFGSPTKLVTQKVLGGKIIEMN